MAERYDFYVHDNRKITFNLTEPIMREDSGVTDFIFHIPKILNELEVSDWQWWLVFVNAKKEKYSIALTLSDDPERPLEFNTATYTVDYAMSIKAGSVQFALEAINAGTGGAIDNEWHTLTYETKVKETLQGNQAEYAETESDVISALLIEVRNKVNQLVGGATPTPVASVSAMTDPSKLYLLTTDGNWYYHNGSAWVSGGVYGAGIVDSAPTQGSTNAVSSGGVYSALHDTDTTLSQSGKPADAETTGNNINDIKSDLDVKSPSLVLTSGSYIYKTGVINSGSSFSYSGPIAVQAGEQVKIKGAGYSTNVAMISTCDVNGSNISPKVISVDADVHDYIYDVVEDGYVCVCFHHGKYYDVKIYGIKSNVELYQNIKNIEYAIDNNFVKPVNNAFEQGTWRNGNKNTDSYAIRFADGYQVAGYSQVIVKANGQYFYLYVYANRTENEGTISFSNIIKTVTWQNTDVTIDVPEGSWIVLVIRKTYPSNTTITPIENAVQMYIADNQILKNKGDIIELNEKIEEISGNIPEYWESEISNIIDTVLTNHLAIGNRIAEFFFITDIHWSGNAKNSPKLINYISKETGIYNVFVGGDVIYTHDDSQSDAYEELRDFYKQFDQNLRMFSTIGNHDLNSNSNSDASTYLSPEQLYICMMKNEEMFTDTEASPYVTIYDNASQKVRFIQFYHPDVIAISSDVKNTVIDAIEEKGSDWTVLIMCHVYWSTGNAVDSYIAEFTEELSVVNASGNYARIAALIVGHMHYDSSTVVGNNLLVIASQCDIYRQTSGSAMAAGTDTEQAFDIYQIDTVQRKIYVTRVGSGSNREFTY